MLLEADPALKSQMEMVNYLADLGADGERQMTKTSMGM